MDRKLYLRLLTVDDASEKYLSWVNDPEMNQYLGLTKDKAIRSGLTIESLKRFIIEKSKADCYFYGIFLEKNLEDQIHIGNIKLEIMTLNGWRTYGIGLIIDKAYWNQRYGTKAIRIVLNYAFNLKIPEVVLAVNYLNENAIKLYEKVGFKFIFKFDNLLYYKIKKGDLK